MNTMIVTQQGGHPLTLNDIGFLQAVQVEGIKGIITGLSDFGNPGYILQGCEIYLNGGTNTLWLTEGYVVIKSGMLYAELFYVPHHNLGVTNFATGPFWVLQETNVAPSPVTYKDNSIKNVHKQRRLTLSTNVFNLGAYANTPQWIDVMRQRLVKAPVWVIGALQNGWSNLSPSEPFRYSKNLNDEVTIQADIKRNPTPATGLSIITQLDSGYEPTRTRTLPVSATYLSGSEFISVPASVRIDTNRNVLLYIESGIAQPTLSVSIEVKYTR